MGRHGLQYCLLCNPFGNGTSGTDGTEAIGKYYLENIPGTDQHTTGWHAVCEPCAKMAENQGYEVLPLKDTEDHPFFEGDDEMDEEVTHDCENPSWTKESLVTEKEGFDWVKCDKCGLYAKRWGINRIEVISYDRPEM